MKFKIISFSCAFKCDFRSVNVVFDFGSIFFNVTFFFFSQKQVYKFDLTHISIILSTGVWICGPEITLT